MTDHACTGCVHFNVRMTSCKPLQAEMECQTCDVRFNLGQHSKWEHPKCPSCGVLRNSIELDNCSGGPSKACPGREEPPEPEPEPEPKPTQGMLF